VIKVDEYEVIRRAYFHEDKSIRSIAREYGHGRELVRKAIEYAEPPGYKLKKPRDAPVLGPYKPRIDELLAENKTLPRKQRYTSGKIYDIIMAEGYAGSESGVRTYVAARRKLTLSKPSYLPLEFDPGQDAQVDWYEAKVWMAGELITVQVFVMRLNYSRAKFVMAFPFQKQEAFMEGHVQAFSFFQGVPYRIAYDNLKTAVLRILKGRNRIEQERFIGFRSYFLFESVFCTPGMANQKGGVESDVGTTRRDFLVPIPTVNSFEELNVYLQQKCLEEMKRRVDRQPTTIGEAFEIESPLLMPLPKGEYLCCVSRPVKANGYSQVTYETNRYSVPTRYAGRSLVLRAFAFRIEVLFMDQMIAEHPRCFGREQDVLDPLHYLTLLEQRPGAFEHAKPIRRWRTQWSASYETLLEQLRQKWPEGRGVREFVRILRLHQDHPAWAVEQAVGQAVEIGCTHYDGVQLCLRQILEPEAMVQALDMVAFPQLAAIGQQPLNLDLYDRLLEGS
jgi:transposase